MMYTAATTFQVPHVEMTQGKQGRTPVARCGRKHTGTWVDEPCNQEVPTTEPSPVA